MSDISIIIGTRIRQYRKKLGLSQEKVAEKAGLHTTYVGQVERGEKNATLESIEKITVALDISLETLFEKLTPSGIKENCPLQAYQLVQGLSEEKQIKILKVIHNILELC